MRDLIAATIFYVVSVLLFPLSLIGYVIWVVKALSGKRAWGGFATAIVK